MHLCEDTGLVHHHLCGMGQESLDWDSRGRIGTQQQGNPRSFPAQLANVCIIIIILSPTAEHLHRHFLYSEDASMVWGRQGSQKSRRPDSFPWWLFHISMCCVPPKPFCFLLRGLQFRKVEVWKANVITGCPQHSDQLKSGLFLTQLHHSPIWACRGQVNIGTILKKMKQSFGLPSSASLRNHKVSRPKCTSLSSGMQRGILVQFKPNPTIRNASFVCSPEDTG